MKYEVVIARSALAAFEKLDARSRSTLKHALSVHLVHEPKMESKSRIKRLEGFRRPQYRLRVDAMRVFYDVDDSLRRGEVLGFVRKEESQDWLEAFGVQE